MITILRLKLYSGCSDRCSSGVAVAWWHSCVHWPFTRCKLRTLDDRSFCLVRRLYGGLSGKVMKGGISWSLWSLSVHHSTTKCWILQILILFLILSFTFFFNGKHTDWVLKLCIHCFEPSTLTWLKIFGFNFFSQFSKIYQSWLCEGAFVTWWENVWTAEKAVHGAAWVFNFNMYVCSCE